MKVRHTITIRARCPVNGDPDEYRCDVFPADVLYCEQVRDAVDELTQQDLLQEELTQKLADRLKCRVRTRGKHCCGRVESVVVCLPQPRRNENGSEEARLHLGQG